MFVLDTDHVVISQMRSAPEYEYLIRRVREHAPSDCFVSIITFHEQVMGWNAYISKARDSAGVVRGYENLQRVLSNFSEAQVLPFVFDDMRSRKVRVGAMDLRIAARFRERTVIPRESAIDFGRVPGLNVEDWTLP